jgi:hypothetical protein
MWCEKNPIMAEEIVRQTGARVKADKIRAYNLPALCLHIGCSVAYILDTMNNSNAGEYKQVCERIMQVIYAQKYEYAMAGIFPAIMVTRELNLGSEEEQKKTAIIQITQDTNTPQLISDEIDVKL